MVVKGMRIFSLCCLIVGIALVSVFGAEQSTLDRIVAGGVLRVGMAASEPAQFYDINTGKWEGFMVEFWKSLGTEMDVTVQFVETSWDLFLLALTSDQFDVFGASTFYRPQRALKVNFSTPLFYKGEAIVARADDARFNTLADVEAVAGVRIGCLLGAVEEISVPKWFPDAEMVTFTAPSDIDVAPALNSGMIDLWCTDEAVARFWLKENPWGKIVGIFGGHPISVAVRFGDYDWLNFIDAYIGYVRTSGDLAMWMEQFGESGDMIWPAQQP